MTRKCNSGPRWPGELTLDEMLSDEIVRLMMRRDGVSEGEVRRLMRRAGRARRAQAWGG